MIYVYFWIIVGQPSFSLLDALFTESQLYSIIIFGGKILKSNNMLSNITEVLLCFFVRRSSQSFVVFNFPFRNICSAFNQPFIIVLNRKKGFAHRFPCYLNNRSNKFSNKPPCLKQIRPKMVEEVDNQSFDVWSIVILISHNHYGSIAKIGFG